MSQHDVQALYTRAKRLIPGGTQLLSKRPEMFAPGRWPAYYRSARGCEIVDDDGRQLIDMSSMGIGSCLLGYADPDVTRAVVSRIEAGSMSSLSVADEVELAELLTTLHPWADMARYARSGGEAMTVAVRIARAHTRRDVVAFCGYHGWHDWYLAANLSTGDDTDHLQGHLLPGLAPLGVPQGLAGTALPFTYNRPDELEAIFAANEDRISAVVMEPMRRDDPATGFLERVRELCDRHGTVMAFDEITAGWRFELGGAHLSYGVAPDIAVFAKSLGNGHPMAAVIGRGEVMQAAEETFISSTYWTEGVGPAAALATIRKMQSVDVPAHVYRIGQRLREGMTELGQRHSLPLEVGGRNALLHFSFDHADNLALQTLFTIEMLDRGILAGAGFYGTYAHRDEHVDGYLSAAAEVFPVLAAAIDAGDVVERVDGKVRHTGFRRLT